MNTRSSRRASLAANSLTALSATALFGAALLAAGCYEERTISSTGPGSERDTIQSPAQPDYWIDEKIFGSRPGTTNREPVTTRGTR